MDKTSYFGALLYGAFWQYVEYHSEVLMESFIPAKKTNIPIYKPDHITMVIGSRSLLAISVLQVCDISLVMHT